MSLARLKLFSRTGFAVLLAAALMAGCDSDGGTDLPDPDEGDTPAAISLSFSPTSASAPADGTASVQIRATVRAAGGDPVADGTSVTFTTTLGSFLTGSGSSVTAPTSGGTATVRVASASSGTAEIAASAIGLTKTGTVLFFAPGDGGDDGDDGGDDGGDGGDDGGDAGAAFQGTLLVTPVPAVVGTGLDNQVVLQGWALDENNFAYDGATAVTWTVDGPGGVPQGNWGIIDQASAVDEGAFAGMYRAAVAAGSYTITAWLGDAKTAVDVDVVDRSPDDLVVSANPPGLDADGSSEATITVDVLDSVGQAVPDGTPVSFQVLQGGGTLLSVEETTVDGRVTVTYRAPGQATQDAVVQATSGGLAEGVTIALADLSPATISVSVVPTNIEQSQSAYVTATVLDGAGAPVLTGTPVTFYVAGLTTATDAEVTPRSASTNPDGKATTTLSAGVVTGLHSVVATAGAVTGYSIVSVVQPEIGSIQFQSASPDVIGVKGAEADGNSFLEEISEVRFLVQTSGGAPVPDGTTVNFTVEGPPGVALLTASAQTVDGIAISRIRSGTVAGLARVRATTAFGGQVFTATSSNIVIQAGPPSDGHFSITVAREHYLREGAYTTSGLDHDITVYAGDRFNNPVPEGTQVYFSSEAGLITGSGVADSDGTLFVELTSADPRPMAVTSGTGGWVDFIGGSAITQSPPTANQWPSRTFDATNRAVNVMAYVWGEESFSDTDGSGTREPGEPFVDRGEPFLDFDGDGDHSAAVTDYGGGFTQPIVEPFWDDDGDGSYSGGNGAFDSALNIFDDLTVYWSEDLTDLLWQPTQYIRMTTAPTDGSTYGYDPSTDIIVVSRRSFVDTVTLCTGLSASQATQQTVIVTNAFSSPFPTTHTVGAIRSWQSLYFWAGDSSGLFPFNGTTINVTAGNGLDVDPTSRSLFEGVVYPTGYRFNHQLAMEDSATAADVQSVEVGFSKSDQDFLVGPVCLVP